MLSSFLNLDMLLFLSFIMINIIIFTYKAKKIKNLRDFAVGNKNLSTASIIASIIATYVSGSNFQINIEQIYNNGLYNIFPLIIGVIFSSLFSSYIIAPRVGEFLKNYSIGEAMGDIYGLHVRIIVSTSGIIFSIIIISVQFYTCNIILSYVFKLKYLYVAVISAAIIMLYSMFNGIRLVTLPNIVQFFTLIFIFPALIAILLRSVDIKNIFLNFHQNSSIYRNYVLNLNNFLNLFVLFIYFAIPSCVYPAGFQKILIAKNVTNLRKAYLISSIILITIILLMSLIGFLLSYINPNVQYNILSYLADNYANSFKGILAIGIIAISMSSTDYYVNSTSTLFINDIYKTLNFKTKDELLLIRSVVLILVTTCFIISLYIENITNLVFTTTSFYLVLILVPFIMTILGLRGSSRAVIIGMIAGLLTAITCKLIFVGNKFSYFILGILANFITLVGYHYLFESNLIWRDIKDKIPLIALRQERREKYKKKILSIKNFNILKFLINNLPQEDVVYIYFGFFSFISICSSMYSLPYILQVENSVICFNIYYSVVVISTLFATYPIYSSIISNKNLIAILWNISTLYTLIFASLILLIISGFYKVQFLIFLMNLIVICTLFRWQVALSFIFFGILFTIQFYKFYKGVNILLNTTKSLRFRRIYLLCLFSIVIIIFFRPKQNLYKFTNDLNKNLLKKLENQTEELKNALLFKDDMINIMNHEIRNPMHGIMAVSNTINDKWDELSNNVKKDAIIQITKTAKKLSNFAENMLDLSQFSSGKYYLNITKNVFLDVIIKQIVSEFQYMYVGNKNLYFILKLKKCQADCDDIKITQVIENLISNAVSYTKEGSIKIKLKYIENDKVEFSIEDQGIGILEEELTDIFKPFTRGSKTKNVKGRGVGLALAKKILNAHGSDIKASNIPEGGAMFRFELPIYHNKSN